MLQQGSWGNIAVRCKKDKAWTWHIDSRAYGSAWAFKNLGAA